MRGPCIKGAAVLMALVLVGSSLMSPPPSQTAVPPLETSARRLCFGRHVTQHGTPGDDVLFGGLGSDVIKTGRGNDTVYGGPGQDFLCGNRGRNDFLFGGEGTDSVHGGKGTEDVCNAETERKCEA